MMPRLEFENWSAHPDARLAIVGASGWIGRSLAHQALTQAPHLGDGWLRLFGARPRPIEIAERSLKIESLDGAAPLDDGDWIVVHAGIVGMRSEADRARALNDALLRQVLTLSETGTTRRVIALSSGAAEPGRTLAASKQAYADMKRAHEDTVAEWSRRTGRPVLIPRVFNIGGPFMSPVEAYALGDFILQITRTGRIAIGAGHPVFRAYVHVLEMARVLLELALDGEAPVHPFDVGGAEIVEMDGLARAVARSLGIDHPVIERSAWSGGEADWYVPDSRLYQSALFRLGLTPTPLSAIVADTAAWLEEGPARS